MLNELIKVSIYLTDSAGIDDINSHGHEHDSDGPGKTLPFII